MTKEQPIASEDSIIASTELIDLTFKDFKIVLRSRVFDVAKLCDIALLVKDKLLSHEKPKEVRGVN